MKKQIVERFWKEFYIQTQEEVLDVAFANPADVSKSLVKARNWSGVLTQELVSLLRKQETIKVSIQELEEKIAGLERSILASKIQELPSWATKNKDIQRSYVRGIATEEEVKQIDIWENELKEQNKMSIAVNLQKEQIDTIRRTLEKTTDWLVQYINWCKYEIRDLNS